MTKKIMLVLALFMSISGTGFASAALSQADGSNDTIEAWGGTRNGGDC